MTSSATHPDKLSAPPAQTRRDGSKSNVLLWVLVCVFLLVGLPIVGLLGIVAASNYLGQGTGTRRMATAQSMNVIASALTQYSLDSGSYPPSLNNLVPKYIATPPLDTWRRPFVYSPNGANGHPFTLYSTDASGYGQLDHWTNK